MQKNPPIKTSRSNHLDMSVKQGCETPTIPWIKYWSNKKFRNGYDKLRLQAAKNRTENSSYKDSEIKPLWFWGRALYFARKQRRGGLSKLELRLFFALLEVRHQFWFLNRTDIDSEEAYLKAKYLIGRCSHREAYIRAAFDKVVTILKTPNHLSERERVLIGSELSALDERNMARMIAIPRKVMLWAARNATREEIRVCLALYIRRRLNRFGRARISYTTLQKALDLSSSTVRKALIALGQYNIVKPVTFIKGEGDDASLSPGLEDYQVKSQAWWAVWRHGQCYEFSPESDIRVLDVRKECITGSIFEWGNTKLEIDPNYTLDLDLRDAQVEGFESGKEIEAINSIYHSKVSKGSTMHSQLSLNSELVKVPRLAVRDERGKLRLVVGDYKYLSLAKRSKLENDLRSNTWTSVYRGLARAYKDKKFDDPLVKSAERFLEFKGHKLPSKTNHKSNKWIIWQKIDKWEARDSLKECQEQKSKLYWPNLYTHSTKRLLWNIDIRQSGRLSRGKNPALRMLEMWLIVQHLQARMADQIMVKNFKEAKAISNELKLRELPYNYTQDDRSFVAKMIESLQC